jgi:dihydrofolate synthase/folylpolyglutamate synthase
MDYAESLLWLRTLPDFERTGDFADRPDVAPMRVLLRALGDPHRAAGATVHIAGSKGKGSTGAMIEAAARTAGHRTGHYVSPHLHRHTERMRLDGQPISQDGFAAALTAVRAAVESLEEAMRARVLAFDVLTAAAFVAFRDAGVAVQVIEVGLGGRLDSTNVFEGTDIVVITPISLEHTQILGDTVAKIAAEKAGIITRGTTVVVAPQRESALDVIRATAAEMDAQVMEVAAVCQLERTRANAEGQDYRLKTPAAEYRGRVPLLGRHQLENAATAVLAWETLAAQRGWDASPEAVSRALAEVQWPGRMEVLKRSPLIMVDGAHNGDSAKRMVAALKDSFGLSRATFVLGTLAGKDVEAMASAVAGAADAVFVTGWRSARAMDPREAAAPFREMDVETIVYGSVEQAIDAAGEHAGGRGAVVAFGALSFVAQVREYLLGIESDMITLASREGEAAR